jgi:hypothetical protein
VKSHRLGIGAVLFAIFAAAAQLATAAPQSEDGGAVKMFLGRWDLTLKAPDGEHPSWLEIQRQDGQLKALFTGRWGNARPLPKIEISGSHISFVSPRDEEGSKSDLLFQGRIQIVAVGELQRPELVGTVNGPDGSTWDWTGRLAPSFSDPYKTGTLKWDKPIQLFNGKDLNGWQQSNSGPPFWTVKDGTLVSPGNGPEIISDQKFQDFKLHIEFNCGTDSNSGVYLRGRYEVQIETESQAEPPSHHTGGVYGFLAPSPELPRSPDVWQAFDITLIGRRVTVIQNGTTIIDKQEIPGITGGAVDSHEGTPGPIYLQGSEKGHVAFRNIVITPAK